MCACVHVVSSFQRLSVPYAFHKAHSTMPCRNLFRLKWHDFPFLQNVQSDLSEHESQRKRKLLEGNKNGKKGRRVRVEWPSHLQNKPPHVTHPILTITEQTFVCTYLRLGCNRHARLFFSRRKQFSSKNGLLLFGFR